MEGSKKNQPLFQETHAKLILGMKLKQLRQERGLSLMQLAEMTNISVSYLNEIEKGKKFPKADKIAMIASKLDISYDWLVSLKMSKKLAPITEILQSRIVKELPLELFGIDKTQLILLLSQAPVKFNAFLNTIIEISRNHGMRVEHFYFSALRSYLEMQDNYFDDIETAVDKFVEENAIEVNAAINSEHLIKILEETYHYHVEEDGLSSQPELQDLRSVVLTGKKPRLLLHKNLNPTQKTFILGREIGFQFMNITDRSVTTSYVEVHSFEQVLNNYKGSYFACALLLNRQKLTKWLQQFLQLPKFDGREIIRVMDEYGVSPEIFIHRLTNLLPRVFGIQELFFLRFSNQTGSDHFELIKEMHLAGLHNPHANMMQEHYCRRWVSINILRDLSAELKENRYTKPICLVQRSRYFGNEKEYLIISFAKPSMTGSRTNNSITIGLLLTPQLKKKVAFWNDPAIPIRMVGETCERCPAADCRERAAEPRILQETQRIAVMKTALEALSDK
jgi:XRE family transcriptional regulator, fatty acid utilization regulator